MGSFFKSSDIQNFNPIFFEKTKEGEKVYDVSSRLVKDRVIYLDCEIDQDVGCQIASLLFLLDREDDTKPISLWITSPGGAVTGFFAIYDMMMRIKAPVRTICIGEACSASAILLAAGTPGMRYAMPSSRIMIHQVQLDGIGGSNAEVEISTKEIKNIQNVLNEILARHTYHTVGKVKRDTKMDKYLSAEDALKYGLVDEIFSMSKEPPPLLEKESDRDALIKSFKNPKSEDKSDDDWDDWDKED